LILEPCLFNGVYAWFFHVTDVPQFKQWAAEQWTGNRRKLIDRAGWPVIRLQKGDWPIDPRLLPGSPVASPKLREEGGGRKSYTRFISANPLLFFEPRL
jgi:hypothetical protein